MTKIARTLSRSDGLIDTMTALLARLRDSVRFWRGTSGVLVTLSLALLVAAIIARAPPDLSAMPVIAVLRDGEHRPIWAIRLDRTAHQIAVDSLRPQSVPPDRVYQLWLLAPDATAPRPLGLLPQSARKRIAVTAENARRLAAGGELEATLEPAGGSPIPGPTGPALFRGPLAGSG
jgi:anti-sigma-K factor RskA